jgi:hypothetical protein
LREDDHAAGSGCGLVLDVREAKGRTESLEGGTDERDEFLVRGCRFEVLGHR